MEIRPFDQARNKVYNRWIINIGRDDLKQMHPMKVYTNYRVCDVHFDKAMKIDPNVYASKTALVHGAYPTLLMPRMPDQEAVPSTTEEATTSVAAAVAMAHVLSTSIARASEPSTSTHVPEMRALRGLLEVETDPGPSAVDITTTSASVEEGARSIAPITEPVGMPPRSAPVRKRRSRKGLRQRVGLLQAAHVTRVSQLTPKAKSLYDVAGRLKKMAADLEKANMTVKERLKAALEYAESEQYFRNRVNKPTFNFLLSQVRCQKQEARGRRYTLDDKIFALTMMKQSPRGYKLLQKVFALPSRKTLNQVLRRVPFHCGINGGIMHSLHSSVRKMHPLDKYAILMWDELSLEPGLSFNEHEDTIEGFHDCGSETSVKIADHAMVFMLRGIRRKWKQPIAYFYADSAMNATDLQRNIKAIVRAVRASGITIAATVSDQLTTNCSAIAALHKDTERWCAHHNVENRFVGYTIDGEEIVHLFDMPHLLKGIRNNLVEADVKFRWKKGQQVASWRDITHFYEHDCNREDDFKLCSRLTDAHIYKDNMKKMKVKMAAQVFSQRLAASMKFMGERGDTDAPSSYSDTSDFLLFVDKLFDSVNGSLVEPVDGKYLRCAISAHSPHMAFWEEALPTLESIRFFSATKKEFTPPSITNWIKTIRGLQHLWRKLEPLGFKFLCPRNLNQDPLENFFGSIRSHGIRNINPTPVAFKASFKSILINNFTTTHSPGSNCEQDDCEGAIDTLRNFLLTPAVDEVAPGVTSLDLLDEDDNFQFSDQYNLVKDQLHSYLAGYVAKKIFKIIRPCRTCHSEIITADHNDQQLIASRAYNPRALLYTSSTFRVMFSKSCEVLHYFLPKLAHRSNLTLRLKHKLKQHVFSNMSCFSCKNHDISHEFAQIFVRFYVHTWIKNINKILKGDDVRDINDDIKKLAFSKYQKKRGRASKVKAMKKLV